MHLPGHRTGVGKAINLPPPNLFATCNQMLKGLRRNGYGCAGSARGPHKCYASAGYYGIGVVYHGEVDTRDKGIGDDNPGWRGVNLGCFADTHVIPAAAYEAVSDGHASKSRGVRIVCSAV